MPEEFTPEEQAILDQTAEIEEAPEVSEPDHEPVQEPEQPEPQPEPQPDPEPAPSKPPEGYVPHQAMHAEREKRKALEARISELEAANAPAPEAPPEFVDPVVDPDGYRKWAEFNNSQNTQAVQQFQQQQAEQQRQAERVMKAQAAEAEFKQSEPDYDEAATWHYNQVVNTFREQGHTDDQIAAHLRDKMNKTYDAAQNLGMNPAELWFMQIKQSGWKKAEPQVNATQRVEALAKAQAATQSITTTGAAQQGKLTLKQLADMSEDELAKIPASEIRALTGG